MAKVFIFSSVCLLFLTGPVQFPEGEKKITSIFLKFVVKGFEAPQISVKTKI